MNRLLARVPSWVVYLGGTVPFLWLVWQVSVDPGPDPVKLTEHHLGKVALWFLVGGLAITPLRRLTGVNLVRYRRAVGLVAFAYVVLHIVTWFTLDMGLLWEQALSDLWRRPYLVFGVLSFAALVPLAVTSNNASVRRLGRNWRRLHWLVYPAVILAVTHYLWQMKVISVQGWIWAGALAVLLCARMVWGLRARMSAQR